VIREEIMQEPVNVRLAEKLIGEIPETANDHDLDAGLAVLCRDMHRYLEQHSRDDASWFVAITQEVNAEDEIEFGKRAFPTYEFDQGSEPHEWEAVRTLPSNLTAQAAVGDPTLAPLFDPSVSLVHEWTVGPGQKLKSKLLSKCRDVVCGPGGPYRTLETEQPGKQIPVRVTEAILAAGMITTGNFWYPLAVYLGILVTRIGLKTYCEP
jgi:hypothetical protein